MIARLETQFKKEDLPIQKLWLYIQPMMRTMDILEKVTAAADEAKTSGGALLNLIYKLSITLGG